MKLYETNSKTTKYLRTERGIPYFEDGWWMHDTDRHEANKRINCPLKRNDKTKQITIDYTIYP